MPPLVFYGIHGSMTFRFGALNTRWPIVVARPLQAGSHMTTHVFTAEDSAGRRCRIQVTRRDEADASRGDGPQAPAYVLEDGSHVRRIDNDTFQIIGTGAYVTRVPD